MLLTEAQVHAIKQIIEDHHNALIVNTIGPEAVAADVLEELKAKGLVNLKVASIKDAYLYGQVLAAMQSPEAATMSYEDFKKYLQKNPVQLSAVEQQALKMAQLNAAQYVKGLGNRVDIATGQTLIEADATLRNQLKGEIRDKTEENIARRETVKKLKSDLGWATGDWARDWDRIAITEKHNAMQAGQADHIAKRYGGDTLVAKRPMPDACEHCKRLHLGPDGQPRIFKLTDLEAFGSNAGRKTKDWKPTIGAVHPHCQCQLIRVPAGWGFNKDGDLVPGGKLGVRYEDPEDIELSLLQEFDLRKSIDSGDDRVEFQGLSIVIENQVGSVRKWRDGQGGTGETTMLYAYGYIDGTLGQDGDEMDCYVGPDPRAQMAYIVHQQNPGTGIYDEEKVMLGFSNEDEARSAYHLHYNRPDFFIAVTPMAMDAFKRWVSGTAPVEKSLDAPRFVILEKGEPSNTTPEAAVSASHPSADARAPSRLGTGVNFYFKAPNRTPPEPVELDRTFTDHLFGKEKRDAIKKDKRDYDMIAPMHREPVPVEEAVAKEHAGSPIGTGLAERNREWLETHHNDIQGVPNEAPTVKKAEPKLVLVKALKGEAATSHKYTKRTWMNDHWVYEYANHHSGKVEGHEHDLGKVVLKVPLSKQAKLEKFQKLHGLSQKLFTTGKYAILPITEAEASALRAKDNSKGKAAPKAAAAKVEPAVTVQAKDIKTLKPLETVSPDVLTKPPWVADFIQSGEKVTVNGKPGTVFGLTNKPGIAVVDMDGGGRANVPWSAVKRVGEPPAYKSTYERMKGGKVYKLDERSQKLLEKAFQTEPVPGTTLQQFVDSFRHHGAEVFMVGGVLRDIVAMTVNEKEHSDKAILDKLNDFDLVTTASPPAADATMRQVTFQGENVKSFEEKPGKFVRDNGKVRMVSTTDWGVIRSQAPGHPGLDMAIAVSEGGHKDSHEEIVFDHDLEADTDRRDFTCNSLYYDMANNVLVDPTGVGLQDAQNSVLRLPPSMDEASQFANKLLPFRYLKFRTRGFAPEAETLKRIKKQFAEQLKATSSKDVAAAIYRTFVQKGTSTAEALKKIKAVMEQDGLGEFYPMLAKKAGG